MLAIGVFEKCKRYIEQHSEETSGYLKKKEVFPCITISRQTGSGSYEVSERLIEILQKITRQSEDPWTYFNKDLITKVIEDYQLPKTLSGYIDESKYDHINDAVNELLGVKPSEWTILQKTTKTILNLARFGKVIIVGRGSNVITSKLPNGFHIRLIAPIEHRIKHVQEIFNFSKPKAMEYIKREDADRKKYLKSHFFRDPDDVTLYNLIINTGQFTYLESARVIAEALKMKFPKCFVE